MNQGAGQRETLLHAPAKGANHAVNTIRQVYPFEHLIDAPLLLFAAHTVDVAEKAHILPGRKVVVERAQLRHIPDERSDLPARHTLM